MKNIFIFNSLTIFIAIFMIACKQDYKDKIWIGDGATLQITDSTAYFRNKVLNKDYLYSIKNDTIIFSNGLCSAFDQKYHIKQYRDKLTLTGFKRYEKAKIDTYKLKLSKDQNQKVGPKWLTSAKILSKSYQCEINGTWYDSLTNSLLVFEEEVCYVGHQVDSLTSFLLFKGSYVCYDENSFFIKNSCSGIRFMIKSRNDTIMNWYDDEFENQSISKNFIYRINDIKIDTSNISEPLFGISAIQVDKIDLKPK